MKITMLSWCFFFVRAVAVWEVVVWVVVVVVMQQGSAHMSLQSDEMVPTPGPRAPPWGKLWLVLSSGEYKGD